MILDLILPYPTDMELSSVFCLLIVRGRAEFSCILLENIFFLVALVVVRLEFLEERGWISNSKKWWEMLL